MAETDRENDTGTIAWLVVLVFTTVAGTLATACMMPFVALATMTALTISRSRAAAFAAYELALFGFASAVGGIETFTAPIVTKILVNDAAWCAALIGAHALLTRAAPRTFGPTLRLSAA